MIFCSTYPYTLVKLHTCVTIKFLNKSWYMIYCAYKIDQDPPKIQPSLKHLQPNFFRPRPKIKAIPQILFHPKSFLFCELRLGYFPGLGSNPGGRKKKEREKKTVSGGHLVP